MPLRLLRPWAWRPGPESPLNLAVLRIAVCAILLASPEWRHAAEWARLPEALRVAPEGLHWAIRVVPITPFLVHVAQVVFVGGAALGLVGLFTRVSLAISTIAALYVFALLQITGSVLHDMHLLWFAAILASSPCADALSLDAWRARRAGTRLPSEPSIAYAVPLTCARVTLGLVYLFPGVWKIASSGWTWIASDNLRNQMYAKWYEHDWTPAVRIDQWPLACHACAFCVIAFELSFLPLALVRRTRPVAAVAGIAFHLATQALMRIGFVGLWGCYVMLFDWSWLEPKPQGKIGGIRRPGPGWLVGAAIIVAIVVQGARGAVQAWPFACYPTFQWVVGDEIPDVVMTALLADGSVVRVPSLRKSQAAWGIAWAVAGMRGAPPTEDALRAYWASAAAHDPRVASVAASAREIQFARGWFSILPGERGQPPRREEPLGTITLRP